jgi:hypothetical protein
MRLSMFVKPKEEVDRSGFLPVKMTGYPLKISIHRNRAILAESTKDKYKPLTFSFFYMTYLFSVYLASLLSMSGMQIPDTVESLIQHVKPYLTLKIRVSSFLGLRSRHRHEGGERSNNDQELSMIWVHAKFSGFSPLSSSRTNKQSFLTISSSS